MKIPEVPEERDQFFAQAPLQFWDIYRDKLNEVMEQLYAFLRGEGTVAILSMDTRGDGGTVLASPSVPGTPNTRWRLPACGSPLNTTAASPA